MFSYSKLIIESINDDNKRIARSIFLFIVNYNEKMLGIFIIVKNHTANAYFYPNDIEWFFFL